MPTELTPRARRTPSERHHPCATVIDPYQWLEDRDSPEVIAHLEAENRYTQAQMAGTEALQQQLYEQTLERIQETDLTVPWRWQDYDYFSRTLEGQDYPQHWRRHCTTGLEQLLLDENRLAADHDFFELADFEVSPDQRLLAIATDTRGDESYEISVFDIESGQCLESSLTQCSGNLVWSMDSQGIFYSTLNQKHRPWRLLSHRLGQSQTLDTLIFEETDERFFLHAYRTKSDKYLIIEAHSKTTSEVWCGRVDTPDPGPLHSFCPRRENHEYDVEHHRDRFLIRSNRDGDNFALYQSPPNGPSEADWQLLVPHDEETTLEGIEPLAGFIVISERCQGQPRLRVLAEESAPFWLEFPDACRSLDCVDNVEAESSRLRVRYESLITPPSLWDIDLVTGERYLLKSVPVLGNYQPERLLSKRIECTARDGTRIPISLVGQKESFQSPAPLLLYAYGAYGEPLDPWFSHARLNLLERGFLFAIAHVRGGGCLGERWYHQGRRQQKMHSFEDFIDCSHYLIEQGLTDPQHLVISGGSAGGLLVGSVLNMAPGLFKAAIADVPFVDILNTMCDPELPLTQTEYDEWGDPNDPASYRYIASYDPISQVKPQPYPDLLVTTALEDTRVAYWEAAKWVATLRDRALPPHSIQLKTSMNAGHGGVSGRYQAYRESAFEQAFILKSLLLSNS
ncbi:S9 family peptidase [Aestuariirhabdus litorea]|uniref:S9 family peptidase n=1 Tax=Aestuariirhabdus litorea TaxID=2528527 RepID=A0A3P3VQ31_9GAMM|nr:S9 family peptidase [Aestuariirhabdus litorea]RRJ84554.1 S9 family peptidase [Aestuariirhabdus litorea]RWW97780.1 S9 family peptidase [Endozoicomonadaceae bacterium GTF-13]